jgi:hypothetical protein
VPVRVSLISSAPGAPAAFDSVLLMSPFSMEMRCTSAQPALGRA